MMYLIPAVPVVSLIVQACDEIISRKHIATLKGPEKIAAYHQLRERKETWTIITLIELVAAIAVAIFLGWNVLTVAGVCLALGCVVVNILLWSSAKQRILASHVENAYNETVAICDRYKAKTTPEVTLTADECFAFQGELQKVADTDRDYITDSVRYVGSEFSTTTDPFCIFQKEVLSMRFHLNRLGNSISKPQQKPGTESLDTRKANVANKWKEFQNDLATLAKHATALQNGAYI